MTAPVSIRAGTADDALCVGVLAMQVFLDTYATDGLRPDLAREALSVYAPAAFEPRLRDRARRFLLAQRQAHLIAFAELAQDSAPPLAAAEGGHELVRLYVQRHFHRQGLGRALLTSAEADAAGSGADCLWLTAWEGNVAARAFYVSQGYTDVGQTQHLIEGQAYANRMFVKRLRQT